MLWLPAVHFVTKTNKPANVYIYMYIYAFICTTDNTQITNCESLSLERIKSTRSALGVLEKN